MVMVADINALESSVNVLAGEYPTKGVLTYSVKFN